MSNLEEDDGRMRNQILSEDPLVGKANLTRFYTGFSTYHSFKSLVDYIEPKASRLKTKRSKQAEMTQVVLASLPDHGLPCQLPLSSLPFLFP